VLGIKINDTIRGFIACLEKDGHTEKSICFAIWKTQDKLLKFKYDKRFINILENEINKWSWKRGDPRWEISKRKKEEEAKAEQLRQQATHEKYGALKPKGYIYFVQGECGGPIKVGYSKDPDSRFKTLQTGYPDILKMLLIIPGSEKTESYIHKMFDEYRINGEWFKPGEFVLEKIEHFRQKYGAKKEDTKQ
jgi:hypothetical protein